MNNKLLLFGAGGHCRSVIDSINKNDFSEIAIIDIAEMVGKNIFFIPVIGTENDVNNFFKQGFNKAFIAFGSIGNPENRIKIYDKLKNIGFEFPLIADRTSIISNNDVTINEGTFIGKGVIVNTGAHIGSFSIINSGAIIDHDCKIGKFVHIATGVSLSGGVIIGDNTHIGTGSSVIQSITIGKNTIIGAGSTVVSDIADNVTAFGVPCKERL